MQDWVVLREKGESVSQEGSMCFVRRTNVTAHLGREREFLSLHDDGDDWGVIKLT